MAHPKAGRPGEGAPVKYFTALLLAEGVAPRSVIDGGLSDILGETDFIGPPHPFDMTDYYASEFGNRLLKRIVALAELAEPEVSPPSSGED